MVSSWILYAIVGLCMALVVEVTPQRHSYTTTTDRYQGKSGGKHRAGPTLGHPPLDIVGEITSLEQVINILGGTAGNLVASLTGISITDCADQIKGSIATMTCGQFLQQLSQCESLQHVKGLIQAAKNKNKKNPNSKQPCFS